MLLSLILQNLNTIINRTMESIKERKQVEVSKR